jgi:hypothetical protein
LHNQLLRGNGRPNSAYEEQIKNEIIRLHEAGQIGDAVALALLRFFVGEPDSTAPDFEAGDVSLRERLNGASDRRAFA